MMPRRIALRNHATPSAVGDPTATCPMQAFRECGWGSKGLWQPRRNGIRQKDMASITSRYAGCARTIKSAKRSLRTTDRTVEGEVLEK